MTEEEKAVKDREAASAAASKSGSRSDPGTDRVMPDGRKIEDVWAENQKKAEENRKLSERLERTEAQLQELLDNPNPSKKDDAEIAVLRQSIKANAAKLRERQESMPWIEIAKEEAEQAGRTFSQEAVMNLEIERGNEYIEDRAVELGINPKELAQKIRTYALDFQDKRPERRNQLAFRAWQAEEKRKQDFDAREAALKKREDDALLHREGRGALERSKNSGQKFDEMDSVGKRSSVVDLIDSRAQTAPVR